MQVQHKQTGEKGFFFIGEEEHRLAEMTYKMSSKEIMVIEHTEVSDALRGKNAGYLLVDAAVVFARAHQIRIRPVCPFAAAVFKKKPEYADVQVTP